MRCGKGGVEVGIDQTQQHQKNVTEKKDSVAKSHYLQNETRVNDLSIPHTQYDNRALLCRFMIATERQPFTEAVTLDASILFNQKLFYQ